MCPAVDEPSLPDLWRRTARRATDTQLAVCASLLPLTIVVSIAVALIRPRWTLDWWPAAAPPLLVSAFGMWGIAERELVASPMGATSVRWGWRSVKVAAIAVAILSAAVIVLWILTRVVGTWIS